MGKKEKEHRKKVAKRNENIKVQQKKFQKMQENFLKELIEREKQAGKFEGQETPLLIDAPELGGDFQI